MSRPRLSLARDSSRPWTGIRKVRYVRVGETLAEKARRKLKVAFLKRMIAELDR